MSRVAVVHGPNLNLLGLREPEQYGSQSLAELDAELVNLAQQLGLTLLGCFQSNHEGVLIDHLHALRETADVLILNPAALTHTSVALRDAVLALPKQCIVLEVHLTNPQAREHFRQVNLLADVVHGRIEGFGALSYKLALHAASALVAARGTVDRG